METTSDTSKDKMLHDCNARQQLLHHLECLEAMPSYAHKSTLLLIRKTISFLTKQLRRYGLWHVALSFNGGKDCTVLLHLLHMAFQKIQNDNNNNNNNNNNDYSLATLTCIYFKEKDEFPEVTDFIHAMRVAYSLQIDEISSSFKIGVEELQREKPIRAIFMGQRSGDPGCTLQSIAPSDKGWPRFDRINPLIDWSYGDVWIFLREFRLPYCSLYDLGYTSLGHRFNTLPNPALAVPNTDGIVMYYRPAWQLTDESREREGRINSY